MPELNADTLQELEEKHGSVVATFVLTQMPEGAAPESIKRDWLGVALPVRRDGLGQGGAAYDDFLRQGETVVNDSPVSVTVTEAVHALAEAGKERSAAFWAAYNLGV